MRLSAAEKAEIIRIVTTSESGVNRSLEKLGIHKRTFYNWYHKYQQYGEEGLKPSRKSSQQWNSIPEDVKDIVIDIASTHTDLSPREIATKIVDESEIFISESSVYRILKASGLIQIIPHVMISASDEFHTKTNFPNEMWQTDFTYFKILGYGWYYLSTILDDYSRYIIHWELCETMKREDVERSIDQAILKAGLSKENPPKLLSDNGSCYIAKDLELYLEENYSIKQIHGAPLHPQTQGKIERYHQSMKNTVKLHNYFCKSELEDALAKWVDYYNNHRYHESLDNLTPADVYLGRGVEILEQRKIIKEESMKQRRINYQNNKIICNSNTKSVNLH